jgi:hypothetical protein
VLVWGCIYTRLGAGALLLLPCYLGPTDMLPLLPIPLLTRPMLLLLSPAHSGCGAV